MEHCRLKMPLVCSQGCQPPPEVGAQVPLTGEWLLCSGKGGKSNP